MILVHHLNSQELHLFHTGHTAPTQPDQDGKGSLKYERLYRHNIPDRPTLAEHAHAYRTKFQHDPSP